MIYEIHSYFFPFNFEYLVNCRNFLAAHVHVLSTEVAWDLIEAHGKTLKSWKYLSFSLSQCWIPILCALIYQYLIVLTYKSDGYQYFFCSLRKFASNLKESSFNVDMKNEVVRWSTKTFNVVLGYLFVVTFFKVSQRTAK